MTAMKRKKISSALEKAARGIRDSDEFVSHIGAGTQLSSKKAERSAPRIAVDALRATFEHHGIKWSTQVTKTLTSDAIKLLCAVAKSAGDASMTPPQACAAMIAARPTK
jgi:hypothetical protein